jgi:uncharacterized caspase-like protein
MRSLATPAASAAAVFKWLIGAHLPHPLGTCQLLLAPSEAEIARLDLGPKYPLVRATKSSFARAAADWRQVASERPGDITFFYFAGHGVQLKKNEQVLLIPGFGKPDDATPYLSEGVLLNEILDGMAQSDSRKKVASTQLYFIDACRSLTDYFDSSEEINNVPQLWRIPKVAARQSTVFQATSSGSQAYSISGSMTVFARALIDSLSGLAGVDLDLDSVTYVRNWSITVNSLIQALEHRLPVLAEIHGLPLQQVNASGKLANVLIARLPEAPLFPV